MPDKPLLLLFAYHYPPDTAIGAARPHRFAKYLRRQGMRVHVITAAKPAAGDADPDLTWVPDPFPDIKTGLGSKFEMFVRKFLLPGVVGTQWAFRACEAARKVMRDNPGWRFVSLSSFPPFGVHLAAARLKRTEGIPWIADFRDPMGNNPSISEFKSFQIALFKFLEARSIAEADTIVANTDSVADLWRRLHPRDAQKVRLLWNGFDPESRIEPGPVPDRSYRLITHVGQLYWGRTAAPLLESLGRLVDRGQLDPSRFRIQLVGSMQPGCLPPEPFLRKATEQGWLDLVPHGVPKAEALEITRTSDGLLLIQPQSDLQVPGKLFEYIQVGRPVLAFILPNSPIERILAKSGISYSCVYAGQSDEAMDKATAAYFHLPFDQRSPSEWFEREFSAIGQTKTLVDLIAGTGGA